jgi:hypothetical protein
MTRFPGLLRRTWCPHCWQAFAPEDVLWIAVHADEVGDRLLGEHQMQRFLPTRFTVDGDAIDARGFTCRELACPHCHLPVPRSLVSLQPLFVSILGTPACGKSYFLTAMTWELRRLLPSSFAVDFVDADAVANRTLVSYEQSLFLNPKPTNYYLLTDLIRKTEEQGDLYDVVTYGEQTVRYPRPFQFNLKPQAKHAYGDAVGRLGRVLCLYDNAGESFGAGRDNARNPVTHHLARARLMLYLFDPTQDQRFRDYAQKAAPNRPVPVTAGSFRQETVLNEAAERIRKLTKLAASARHDCLLLVIATKLDAWDHLLPPAALQDPWVIKPSGSGLDLEAFEQHSDAVGALLRKVTPEVPYAAEGFADRVRYVAVSALGRLPAKDKTTGKAVIRPVDLKPRGVCLPIIYGLSQELPGLISFAKRKVSTPVSGVTK